MPFYLIKRARIVAYGIVLETNSMESEVRQSSCLFFFLITLFIYLYEKLTFIYMKNKAENLSIPKQFNLIFMSALYS